MSEALYTQEQFIRVRNENYAAGRADERKALFAILEQLPFTWYGTKQNLDLGKDELIAFIEGKINE